MKKLLLATALAATAGSFTQVLASSSHLIEVNSVSQFDELLKTNSKVVVDFWAEWCGPCKRLLPILTKLGNESTDIMYIKVRHGSSTFESLASRYGVKAFPTLIAFKDCCKMDVSIGFKTETDLKKWVNSVLA